MDQTTFDAIMKELNKRIIACKNRLDFIHYKEDLEKLTLEELKSLRVFCASEVSKQTRIVANELYHILGMGKLNATQTTQFIAGITTYLHYRPILQSVASISSIDYLPNFPLQNSYQLQILTNEVLSTGVLDPNNVKKESNERKLLPSEIYTLDDDDIISIPVAALPDFNEIAPKFGAKRNLQSLIEHINKKDGFWGILWNGIDQDTETVRGEVFIPNVRKKLQQLLLET